jgi:hypothetical protein
MESEGSEPMRTPAVLLLLAAAPLLSGAPASAESFRMPRFSGWVAQPTLNSKGGDSGKGGGCLDKSRPCPLVWAGTAVLSTHVRYLLIESPGELPHAPCRMEAEVRLNGSKLPAELGSFVRIDGEGVPEQWHKLQVSAWNAQGSNMSCWYMATLLDEEGLPVTSQGIAPDPRASMTWHLDPGPPPAR